MVYPGVSPYLDLGARAHPSYDTFLQQLQAMFYRFPCRRCIPWEHCIDGLTIRVVLCFKKPCTKAIQELYEPPCLPSKESFVKQSYVLEPHTSFDFREQQLFPSNPVHLSLAIFFTPLELLNHLCHFITHGGRQLKHAHNIGWNCLRDGLDQHLFCTH
jgi:hypothetical protein